MVYKSWLTMQARGETNANTCQYNDLALVRIDPADVAEVNPSVPGFGGPTGVGSAAVGQTVYSYGNSSLRGGVTQLRECCPRFRSFPPRAPTESATSTTSSTTCVRTARFRRCSSSGTQPFNPNLAGAILGG